MLRRQTTLCREGWYYLAILALVFGGALLKEVNLLLILAGMLLGPLLLNWRAVRATLNGLTIRRQLPSGLCAGDALSVPLELTNPRPRLGCWAVVAEENIERETAAGPSRRNHTAELQPSVLFPYVAGGQSRKGAYRGRLMERGRYRFGPVRLSTRFPFGLCSRTIAVGQPETLVVLPRLGRLTDVWASRPQEAFSGVDRRRQRSGGDGDFYGVREWRRGDGQRTIHWRSSARLDRLVVRQLERPRTRDVAVVLDLWRPDRPAVEEIENVELAVSFAATVLADACRTSGSNVMLAFRNAEPEFVAGPASPATLQGMTERLATVEARSDDALPGLLLHALPQIASDTEIVLVSTRATDPADASRFAPLGNDSALRDRMRRILCVDTSSERLGELFQMDV